MSIKENIKAQFKRLIPSFYFQQIPETEIDTVIDILCHGLSLSGDDIADIDTLYDIDKIDADFLPYLSYLIGYVYDFRFVETNAFLTNDVILRNQLKQAVAWMRLKGTVLAIKQYLISLGVSSDVQELWYNGDYNDLIPSERYQLSVTNELFRNNIANNSIQYLYQNAGIDTSEINDDLHEFVTGSFVHSNIVDGTIEAMIVIDNVVVTKIVQDVQNNFEYGYDEFGAMLDGIPVNLGKVEIISANMGGFVIPSTQNTLYLDVDGTGVQTVVLATQANKSAGLIANEINNQTVGVRAYAEGDRVILNTTSNTAYTQIEVIDGGSNAYDVLGIDVGVYAAATRTVYDDQTELLIIELLELTNFSTNPAQVLVNYDHYDYGQPTSIKDHDYSTGAKSNWFDVTMTANNDAFVLTSDIVDRMIENIKAEIKPFHALLRQVNYQSIFEDTAPDAIDDVCGQVINELNDYYPECCIRHDNCVLSRYDGAIPVRVDSGITRSGGCLPKGMLITHNGFIQTRPHMTTFFRALTEYTDWGANANLDMNKNIVFRDGDRYEGNVVYHYDYCQYPKVVGLIDENYTIETGVNDKLFLTVPGYAPFEITLTAGTWNAEQIASIINSTSVADAPMIISNILHQLGEVENIMTFIYDDSEPRREILVSEITITTNGTVEISFDANEAGMALLSKSDYESTFTNQTSVTITSATHGLGSTDDMLVYVVDSNTPRRRIIPHNVNIQPDGTVTVDFDEPQSGVIMLRNTTNYQGTFTTTDTFTIDSTTHGVGVDDELIVQLFDVAGDMIIPRDVSIDNDGNITVELDEADSGIINITDAEFSTVFDTSLSQGLIAMGLGGFVRIIGTTGFDYDIKVKSCIQLGDIPSSAYATLGFEFDEYCGKVCPATYHQPPTELETSNITTDAIMYKIYDTDVKEIIPNEIQIGSTGIINLTFDTDQAGKILLAGNYSYSNTFSVTSPLFLAIPSAIHGLGIGDNFAVNILNDEIPRKQIIPRSVTIDPLTGDIVVEFDEAQDGLVVVRQPVKSYIKDVLLVDNDTVIIPASEHLLNTKELGVYIYDTESPRNVVIPREVTINNAGDVTVEFDGADSVRILIHADWEFSYQFDTATGSGVIVPGVTGQLYLGNIQTEEDQLLLSIN